MLKFKTLFYKNNFTKCINVFKNSSQAQNVGFELNCELWTENWTQTKLSFYVNPDPTIVFYQTLTQTWTIKLVLKLNLNHLVYPMCSSVSKTY